jgi:two-component system, chemotaxis family, protein-glutamate methylesterase/glutaminase
MKSEKIKVLVVEDSPTVRELLLHVLNAEPDLEVTGTARNGAEAVAAVKRQRPDVVTMDIQMPQLDGYAATRAIMECCPVPIVVVSNTVDQNEVATTFRALEAGAVMALGKPAGPSHPEYEARARELVTAVRLMSEVKVVRRLARYHSAQTVPTPPAPLQQRGIRAVAIGASTGGPLVLQQILGALPGDFPAPIFVVQHMAHGFIGGLAGWLDQSCALTVQLAQNNTFAKSRHVYIAPDDYQLSVSASGRIQLTKEQSNDGFCPSISYLFRTLAEAYGEYAAGVLLTGMGEDGAAGLKALYEKGALTIAQDERSSVVFGMPAEAIRLSAVECVLAPDEIPGVLLAASRDAPQLGSQLLTPSVIK